MSIPCKFERSILSHDEYELILRSHHPEIYDAGLDDLKALRQRLHDMRDRERTLARENRRAARGKGAPRGRNFSLGALARDDCQCSLRLGPDFNQTSATHPRYVTRRKEEKV